MNIVYNKILVYDPQGRPELVSSNIPKYNIHPWHTHPIIKDGDGNYEFIDELSNKLGISFPYRRTGNESREMMDTLIKLKSQSFEVFLDHEIHKHNILLLDEVVDKNIKYVYPIITYNNALFDTYRSVEINHRVISDAKDGKCKICFIQPTEGFFGQDDDNYRWFDDLSKKYGLDETNLYMITTNFIAKTRKGELVSQGVINDKTYTILDYAYFGTNLWFHDPGRVSNPESKKVGRQKLSRFIKWSLTEKKELHFLNFNRVPKLHRLLLYGFLNSNETFKGKFISSLGGMNTQNQLYYYDWVRNSVPSEFNDKWKNRIMDYYRTHNSTEHYWYDEPDLENNKANNLNTEAHKKSFVNIVSESLTHQTTVFFSEKIYKPIFVAQPFILMGNPKSLEVLQNQGYKTFSKWWDESYDQELDFYKRMDKIFTLMEEISSWDLDKCFEITQEMLPTLIHNFNILMKGETLQNMFKELGAHEELPTEEKGPTKRLI